ncbi:ribonuclease Z [Pseudomonas matsuisoli]|uniref:Ribonuclease Z n=1 Tax=Pseudomonas matsuisoli TaxID=1515666 RepID=A0A917UXU8_9PSED|nr:ribonuclease Z [Pseudomonas matsuisoli]GGJ96215.1 ribonuclease Z [Pseudomonas matsuisoli]
MDLIFLGTSAGTPTRSRNVSGLAVLEESGRGWHLVDCGEGTQHQILRTPLSLHTLESIFITHVHGDHCYGLPGLVASAGLTGRRAPLRIVGPADIERWLTTTLTLTGCTLPFELHFEAVERTSQWQSHTLHIDAWPLSHRVPSYAYRFTEARPGPQLAFASLERDGVPKGPLWGRLLRGEDVENQGRRFRSLDYVTFDREPRRILVAGDNDRPELLADACDGAQVLVHEATYTADVAERAGPNAGHSSAFGIAQFAQATGLPHLVLTHFSARYQNDERHSPSIETLREEAAAHYDGALFMAKDFQRYRLDKHGALMLLPDPA